MPFKSKEQKDYLHEYKPDVAKKFEKHKKKKRQELASREDYK